MLPPSRLDAHILPGASPILLRHPIANNGFMVALESQPVVHPLRLAASG